MNLSFFRASRSKTTADLVIADETGKPRVLRLGAVEQAASGPVSNRQLDHGRQLRSRSCSRHEARGRCFESLATRPITCRTRSKSKPACISRSISSRRSADLLLLAAVARRWSAFRRAPGSRMVSVVFMEGRLEAVRRNARRAAFAAATVASTNDPFLVIVLLLLLVLVIGLLSPGWRECDAVPVKPE